MSVSSAGVPAVPPDLVWQFSGLLRDGAEMVSHDLFDQVVTSLPKDPEVRATIYHAELAGGVATSWHLHNGPIFVVLLRGEMILQFLPGPGEPPVERLYKAGDALVEPVGVVHRAYNPNPEIAMAGLGFQFTAPDRNHRVDVPDRLGDTRPRTAPRGGPVPQVPLHDNLPRTR
jgi:quercetin dioxygenase-like cupin family protein